jgi:phosphopantothenoylcysteine decarboxylase/phosphopantothenate--cysteine ligase
VLAAKVIVLGVTGSIAAYKAVDIASKLTQGGALVDVVMTEAATRFVTPLTMRSMTRRPVFVDMFDPASELAEEHWSWPAGPTPYWWRRLPPPPSPGWPTASRTTW